MRILGAILVYGSASSTKNIAFFHPSSEQKISIFYASLVSTRSDFHYQLLIFHLRRSGSCMKFGSFENAISTRMITQIIAARSQADAEIRKEPKGRRKVFRCKLPLDNTARKVNLLRKNLDVKFLKARKRGEYRGPKCMPAFEIHQFLFLQTYLEFCGYVMVEIDQMSSTHKISDINVCSLQYRRLMSPTMFFVSNQGRIFWCTHF